MFDEIDETAIGIMGPNGRPEDRATNTPTANRRPNLFLNDIHDLAYKKWMAAGKPPGDCTQFWLEAEQEIQEAR